MQTTVPDDETVNGEPLRERYVGEFLPKNQIMHFFDCLKRALSGKETFCSYILANHVFLARMEKISDRRVLVIERNVTGFTLTKAVMLF